MMILKRALTFSPSTENPGRCAYPNDVKRRQPAYRACRWDLLRDSLADSSGALNAQKYAKILLRFPDFRFLSYSAK